MSSDLSGWGIYFILIFALHWGDPDLLDLIRLALEKYIAQ